MHIEAIKKITGTAVPMFQDDIDTDRIIPGRFLKCVTFDGLGEYAFFDERYDAGSAPVDHPFNDPRYEGANILLAGRNFGCGSSREHAPQALKRAGVDAVVAESFAEIFYGNAITLGIVCVQLQREFIAEIVGTVKKDPGTIVHINLEANRLAAGSNTYSFHIKENARAALMNGTYDSLAELLRNMPTVHSVEATLPYRFERRAG